MNAFTRLFLTPGKRPRRWLCWLVGLYAVYCLLAGLILPYALRGVVEKQLSAALSSNCTLERLAFNPFTFTAGAYGLVIPYPEGDGNFLTLESVELAPGFSTIARLAPALGHLTVVNPTVTMTLSPDGSMSLSQFAAQKTATAPAPDPDSGAASAPAKEGEGGFFPFIVSNLTLRGGKVDFFDHMHNATHTVRDLNFHVPFTSSLEGDRQRAVRPTLNATIDDRPVSLDGRTTPFAESQRTEFRLNIGELPLERLRPYVEKYTSLSPERGRLTAETVLRVEKTEDGSLGMGLSGSLYVNDLALTAGKDGTVFSLDYAALEMDHVLLRPQRVAVTELSIHNPMLRLAREKDGSVNWQRYLRPSGPPSQKATSPAGKNATAAVMATTTHNASAAHNATAGAQSAPAGSGNATAATPIPVVSIAKFSLVGGHVHWQDALTAGGVTQEFTPIGLEVRDFNSEGAGRGRFVLTLGQESVAAQSVTEAFFTVNAKATGQHAGDKAGATNATVQLASTNSTTPLVNATARTFTVTPPKADPAASSTTRPKPSPSGNFALRGLVTLKPLTLELQVASDRLSLMHAAPYLQGAGVTLKEAALDANTAFTLRAGDDNPLLLSQTGGDVALRGLFASLPLEGAALSLDAFRVSGAQVDLGKNSAHIDTITLAAPHAQLALGKVAATTKESPAKAKGKAPAKASARRSGKRSGAAQAAAPGVSATVTSATTTHAPGAGASPTGGTAGATTASKPGAPFVLSVKTLRIAEGRADVTASGGSSPALRLSSLDCTVSDFSTLPGKALSFTGSGLWNTTGKIAVVGKAVLSPLKLEVSPKFTAIPLQSLAPWLRDFSALTLNSGALSCDLNLKVAETATSAAGGTGGGSAGAPAVSVTGGISLADLSLREGKQETVGFRRLQVSDLRLDSAAATYDIGSLTLSGPRVDFTLYADGMDSVSRAMDVSGEEGRKARRAQKQTGPSALAKAVQEQEKAQEAAPSKDAGKDAGKDGAAEKIAAKDGTGTTGSGKSASGTTGARTLALQGVKRFTLGRFTMQEGSAHIRDERLAQRATISLSGLNLTAAGISSAPGSTASFNLTGKVEGAPLSLEAKSNPLYMPVEGQVKFSLQDMDVTSLSPYSLKYIAYPIDKGALSLNIDVRSENGMLASNNVIVLNQLTLGDKADVPGAPNLPIKLGLSLLEDSRGVVNLTLPIAGRLDDPEVRTGGVVIKAIAGILFKIVASPFSLLGSVLGGGDGPSMQYVAFDPGDDRLNAKALASIQAVVELLRKKPGITLVLQGMADEAERTALGPAYVRKGVQALKWEDLGSKEQAATLPADVVMDRASEEYASLLFDFYADQKFDKPKTLGVTREQPVEVMEKMIAERVPATDAAIDALARSRVKAVQDEVARIAPDLAKRVSVAADPKIRESAQGQAVYSRVELGIK